MAFGVSPDSAAKVVAAVRKSYNKTLIVKLSPNVSDICSIARAVEEAGADALSLINTFLGMAINSRTLQTSLKSTNNRGPFRACIKPIALRMVWQVAQAVSIPVIGMGGISCLDDVIEFLLAGATAVQIGYYNFIDPSVSSRLVKRIRLLSRSGKNRRCTRTDRRAHVQN